MTLYVICGVVALSSIALGVYLSGPPTRRRRVRDVETIGHDARLRHKT